MSAPVTSLQMRVRLAILSFILTTFCLQMLTGLIPTAAAQDSKPADTAINPFGVNTFFDKEVEFWKKERTMQMISEGGIKWIKQIFAWNELEFRKGYFYDDKFKKSSWEKFDEIVNLATKYNVGIVARVDQAPAWTNPASGKPGGRPANLKDYADFLAEFVKHYKGKIKHIQVWNEPNLEVEWIPGQKVRPAEYTEMLKLAYKAIKEVDPTVRVMAAPLAITMGDSQNMNELEYLGEMYKSGAKEYFDILPANAYGLEFPPEDAPDPKKLNMRRVELLRDVMVKNGDANKAVWFNEYGWNASPSTMAREKLIWRRVSEQQQSDYTVRGLRYAQKNYPWVGVVFIWFFRQVGDIPDDASVLYFQMVTKDFTPKPVYEAVKQEAFSYLKQNNLATPAPVTPASADNPNPNSVNSPGTAVSAPTGGANPTSPATAKASVAAAPTPTAPASIEAVAPKPTAPSTGGNTTVNTPASTPQDNNILLILLGGFMVLVAGGGLAYWAIQQRNFEEEE